MSERLDRIEAILEQTASRLDQVAGQQATNTAAIANLTEEVDSLRDIVMHSIGNAETDREVFQAEIRRIWEYLLGQQRNGHGSS
jgi:flagellin-like hook-associated protein FlgL